MPRVPGSALLLAAALGAACASRPEATPAPVADAASLRTPPAGPVVGFLGAYGAHAWLGIPYAKPPEGALRWRAPEPLPAWQTTREALAFGASCTQFASSIGGVESAAAGTPVGSEDCLFLNVYAPPFQPDAVPQGDARLPVMLWIHGGGNSIGRAGFYDGGHLAATHDVVVVAINYRLGPFGWFRHAALRGEGTTAAERSGNFGQLDQLRALEWVRANIAAFGGDPANVTIFGGAAGGSNVWNLVLSPLARDLFHRAIVQSSGGFGAASAAEAEHWADDPDPGRPHSSSEVLARLLVRDGAAADRQAAKARVRSMTGGQTAAYLRSRSQRELLAAYVADPDSYGGMYGFPGAVRDGAVLPAEPPMQSLARGAYNRVPILTGTNRDEMKLLQALNPDLVRWRLGLFPHALDPERYDAAAEHHAKLCRAHTVHVPAALMRAVQGPSVYAYRWDWDDEPRLPFLYDGPQLLGAAHGLEVAFVFGHFDLGPDTRFLFGSGSRAGRAALAGQMMSYWTEFAYTGAPGRGRDGDLPAWTAWDPSTEEAPRYMVLDTVDGGGLRMESKTETIQGALAGLFAEPRLPERRQRCAVLVTARQWTCVTPEEYAAACPDYPFEAFPWPAGSSNR
jgi:para-nitrobenzyl esterase